MENGINEASARLPVVRLAITIIRMMTKTYFDNERFGVTADELILCLSIFIGQVEGKPMNASKLAEYAGLPRPSAIRKLASLRRRELIFCRDGAYFIPEHLLNDEQAVASARRIRRELLNTARMVSKMDSLTVAQTDLP